MNTHSDKDYNVIMSKWRPIFQRKGIYYTEYRRQRISLETRNEQKALSILADLQREKLREIVKFLPDKNKGIALSAFLSEYRTYATSNLASNTNERLFRILSQFQEVVGAKKVIGELEFKDLDDLVTWHRKRGNTGVTIGIAIRHIKAAFTFAVGRKHFHLKENPFKGYKAPKYQKKKPRFLTLKEIEKVFQVIAQSPSKRAAKIYRLVFASYIYTGGRREEIHRYEAADFDFKNNQVEIRKTKNYIPRSIALSEKYREILLEHGIDKAVGKLFPMKLSVIARQIKEYLVRAGLADVRPHDLRHTFASHLIMAGVDLKTVGELLGHTSLAATQIYVHLLDAHKKKAISKLPY